MSVAIKDTPDPRRGVHEVWFEYRGQATVRRAGVVTCRPDERAGLERAMEGSVKGLVWVGSRTERG